MAIKILWTPRAIKGFEEVVVYLEKNWTEKEVRNFITRVDHFVELLSKYPRLLEKSDKKKQLYRGPIDTHNILTYRYRPRKQQIELLNIYSSKRIS